MNYTELYTNTRTTLCKAIAEQIPEEYLDINCQDPINQSQVFVGVYKSKDASYIESRLADRTFKSDSIYTLTVDQAYEVLKAVMTVLQSNGELYTVEIYNAGQWKEVFKSRSYRLAQAEYEERCKVWAEVRLQKWN